MDIALSCDKKLGTIDDMIGKIKEKKSYIIHELIFRTLWKRKYCMVDIQKPYIENISS